MYARKVAGGFAQYRTIEILYLSTASFRRRDINEFYLEKNSSGSNKKTSSRKFSPNMNHQIFLTAIP